jgi:sulfate adenylyltransferase
VPVGTRFRARFGAGAGAGAGLPAPHGGRLVDAVLRGEEAAQARARARELPAVALGGREAGDLELIATGGYSPLAGFMDAETYRGVVEAMRLPDGLLWPLPVVLPADPTLCARLPDGGEVALCPAGGEPVGILRVEDRFSRDLVWEARHVYGTGDPSHPGVRRLLGESPFCLAGPVVLFARRESDLGPYRLDPADTRAAFAARGWRRVAAFQTRTPAHRAHEYLQKCALEATDGLLLHPLAGDPEADDAPAAVRLASYETLLRHYYPDDRVLLAAFPAALRHAGPREAVFHALCRRNYGCSHFVVGRDHAGAGRHYGAFDAQRLVAGLADEIGVTPLCFDHAFYCRRCGGMATAKTCPHAPDERLALSGTRVREMLRRGEAPPPEHMRPEVASLLVSALAAGSAGTPAAPET